MTNIIDLSNIREFKLRELEKIFEDRMVHDNADVLELWKKLAKESLRKYPGAPTPSQNELSLTFPTNCSENERNKIVISIKEFLSNYQNDVQNTMLEMLEDIVVLQKGIAEEIIRNK